VQDGKLINRFIGHTIKAFSVIFSKNEDMVISSAGDKSVIVWNLKNFTMIARMEG